MHVLVEPRYGFSLLLCSILLRHTAAVYCTPWLQGLSESITTLQRVRQRGHLLLIHCCRNGGSTTVKGFIKTGLLNLFLADVLFSI